MGAGRTASTGVERDHYFRQLWDWKASADIDSHGPGAARLLRRDVRPRPWPGPTLAAATPSPSAAYVGGGTALGEAMAGFSAAYADLNERDHAEAVGQWSADAETTG